MGQVHTEVPGEEAASPNDCSLILKIGFSNPHEDMRNPLRTF